MSRYLIDTDWIVDALYGIDRAVETLVGLAPRGLAVSLITYAELYQGAYYARDSSQALAGLQRFLNGKDLLPVTPAVAERFGIVRGSISRQVRQQVGDMDLLIAATALTHDLILVTRNMKDFQHVPGLETYQANE